MHTTAKYLVASVLSCVLLIAGSGCMEEVAPEQSQTSPNSTPAPASETGPITNLQNQGGGSSLGAVKRSATNVVNQAEAESRRVAKQAGGDDEPAPPPDDE